MESVGYLSANNPSGYTNLTDGLWRSSSQNIACSQSGSTANNIQYGSSPTFDSLCRMSPLDSNMGSFSLSPIDFDPLPNIFFNACPPSYKDFPVYKEKNPHDMADVLLSLKHAVVHPGQQMQMGGCLPSLSPVGNLSGYGPSSQTSSASGMPYPMHPQAQMMSTGHPGYNQYSQCLEAAPPPLGPQPSQGNMFPSMSVNVSMNMTMGVGMGYNVDQCNPAPHQMSWNATSGPPPSSGGPTLSSVVQPSPQVSQNPSNLSYAPHHHQSQNLVTPIQMSYTPGAPPNYTASGSYSFTAEFRPSETLSSLDKITTPVSPKISKSTASSPSFGFTSFGPLRKRPSAPPRPTAMTHVIVTPDTASALKTNLCRICGKTYARPSTLKTHMRTHSGEKPYRCSTCNKSFSQAANLTAHIRTHSGEKPFRCPICDRRFSQSSSVTTHMRTHSGERPYRCRMCKKAFSDSSTLTKHLRIHSGEKPYQCKLCLLRFSQSGNLNRHMRVHSNSS